MTNAETAVIYRRFAEIEAHARSPLYEQLAQGVAADAELLSRLEALPQPKRQPNLLFAAGRHVSGVPSDWSAFRRSTLARWDEVRDVMLERSTQTNEPGRCAVLLPVLSRLPQPLALIEVGASAGLCLLPDRYGYDYGGRQVRGPDLPPGAPVFPCQVSGNTPVPDSLPVVAWRAGLDLSPLDVGDADQMAWLQTLVWPDQADRAARLRAAISVAAGSAPRVVAGDLRHTLASLAAEAPSDATLVIYHTAVLAYVQNASDRAAFAQLATSIADAWISNEAPAVLPDILSRAPGTAPKGRFLLAVNGAPVAWTDPHGAAMEWLADPALPEMRQRGTAR